MDFPFSPPAPDGYFASQAIRAGIIGDFATRNPAMDREIMKERIREEILAREMAEGRILKEEMRRERIREEILAREMAERRIFQEEMRKERIREEIIARDMEERRILEEEVRREIEIERVKGVRQVSGDMYSDPVGNRTMRMVSKVNFGERFRPDYVARLTKVGCDERIPLPIAANTWDRKNSPFSHGPFEEKIIKPASVIESKPSKLKLSGVKRKAMAVGGARGLPSHILGCALCEVTATSNEALDEHLQGKKHKAKAAALAGSKTRIIRNNFSASAPKEAGCISGDKPANGPKQVSSNGSKKQQQEKTLWCKLCKVKCNSLPMLASHVSGKKHNAQLELQKMHNAQLDLQKKHDALAEAKEHNEAPPNTSELMTDTEASGAQGVKQDKNEEVEEEKNQTTE